MNGPDRRLGGLVVTWRHLARMGALALLVGFFLPWASVSCGDGSALVAGQTGLWQFGASGFNLAVGAQTCQAEPGLWLVPLAGIAVLVASYLLADQLSTAFVTVSASLLALLRLLVTYDDLQAAHSASGNVELGPGVVVGVGAIVWLLGVGGVALLRRAEPTSWLRAEDTAPTWPGRQAGTAVPEELRADAPAEDATRAEDEEIGEALRLLRDGTREEKIGARYRLAAICEQRALFDEAAELYETNIRNGVRDPRLYDRLTAIYRKNGEPERAEQVEREAERLREARVYSSEQEQRGVAPTIFSCRSCWAPLDGTATSCERCGASWQRAS